MKLTLDTFLAVWVCFSFIGLIRMAEGAQIAEIKNPWTRFCMWFLTLPMLVGMTFVYVVTQVGLQIGRGSYNALRGIVVDLDA